MCVSVYICVYVCVVAAMAMMVTMMLIILETHGFHADVSVDVLFIPLCPCGHRPRQVRLCCERMSRQVRLCCERMSRQVPLCCERMCWVHLCCQRLSEATSSIRFSLYICATHGPFPTRADYLLSMALYHQMPFPLL